MDKNEPDLVEQSHREAVQRRREQEVKEHALVEAMFREARERQRQEEEQGNALVDSVHREAVERARQTESSTAGGTAEGDSLHRTAGSQARRRAGPRVESYRREVGRLLPEGRRAGSSSSRARRSLAFTTRTRSPRSRPTCFPLQPFFVHEIRAEEPYLRIRGVNLPCRSHVSGDDRRPCGAGVDWVGRPGDRRHACGGAANPAPDKNRPNRHRHRRDGRNAFMDSAATRRSSGFHDLDPHGGGAGVGEAVLSQPGHYRPRSAGRFPLVDTVRLAGHGDARQSCRMRTS